MPTEKLIAMDQSDFSDFLFTLEANTCERHARKIVEMLGGHSFDKYIEEIADIVVSNAMADKHETMPYFQQTEKSFPGVLPDSDILQKLVGLTLIAVTLRIENYKKKRF